MVGAAVALAVALAPQTMVAGALAARLVVAVRVVAARRVRGHRRGRWAVGCGRAWTLLGRW